MNPTHELATVADLIARMRAEGALLDYAKYAKLAVMLEAFADSLDRELDLQTRPDPREEAPVNVKEWSAEL